MCARCKQDSYCVFIMKLSYHIMIALVVDKTGGCGGSLFCTTRCALFVQARFIVKSLYLMIGLVVDKTCSVYTGANS